MADEPYIDPVVEYYKQFVDGEKLRENIKLPVEARFQRLQQMALEAEVEHRLPPSPERPWDPVSECGPGRSSDPVIELYKRDVDVTLLRENLRRTHNDRFAALASMAELVNSLQHEQPQ